MPTMPPPDTATEVDASESARHAPPPRDGRDRLLDVVRALAIGRVVLWHTWSSWWLSWFPAMPAMFFTTGALLEDSLDCTACGNRVSSPSPDGP